MRLILRGWHMLTLALWVSGSIAWACQPAAPETTLLLTDQGCPPGTICVRDGATVLYSIPVDPPEPVSHAPAPTRMPKPEASGVTWAPAELE